MRKRFILSIALIVMISLTACETGRDDTRQTIWNTFKIDVPQYSWINYRNSYGGWQGKGDFYAIVEIQDDEKDLNEEQIEGNGHWYSLPMDEALEVYFYGGEPTNPIDSGRIQGLGGYLAESKIPRVEKGYYYYKDRNKDYEAPGAFSWPAGHDELAIYDSENALLYFVISDS